MGITEGSIFLACKGDRAARGAALAKECEFSLIPAPEGARAHVPSLSSSGTVYEVRLFNGRALQASCSCKDYIDHGPLCQHGVAVLLRLAEVGSPSVSPGRGGAAGTPSPRALG